MDCICMSECTVQVEEGYTRSEALSARLRGGDKHCADVDVVMDPLSDGVVVALCEQLTEGRGEG